MDSNGHHDVCLNETSKATRLVFSLFKTLLNYCSSRLGTQPLLNFDPWLARSSFAIAPLLSVCFDKKLKFENAVLFDIRTGTS